MAKFRRRAVEVEAEQFFSDRMPPKGVRYHAYCGGVTGAPLPRTGCSLDGHYYIRGSSFGGDEGTVILEEGDWVVVEPGGTYVLKPERFEEVYEHVSG